MHYSISSRSITAPLELDIGTSTSNSEDRSSRCAGDGGLRKECNSLAGELKNKLKHNGLLGSTLLLVEDNNAKRMSPSEHVPKIGGSDTPKSLSPTSAKKPRTKTLLDFKFLPKVQGKADSASPTQSFADVNNRAKKCTSIKPTSEPGDSPNVFCPITGCSNRGGRGSRRAGISKHPMGKHPLDLVGSSPNYASVCKMLQTLDRRVCVICNRFTIFCTAQGFCDKCDEKRPAGTKIIKDPTENKIEKSKAELIQIQNTKFTLRRTVPKKLRTLSSDLLTDIAMGMADATKESDAWRVLRRYLMVKAVLIQGWRKSS